MTEVVIYRCRACKKDFGTMGMHGYDPKGGNGERPVVCRTCKAIYVGQYKGGKLTNPDCHKCKRPLALLDGKCPACGSDELYFRDVHFPPDMEMKAVDLTKK